MAQCVVLGKAFIGLICLWFGYEQEYYTFITSRSTLARACETILWKALVQAKQFAPVRTGEVTGKKDAAFTVRPRICSAC